MSGVTAVGTDSPDDRWAAAEQRRRTGEPVEAEVVEANRGGLIVRLLGLRGFLPQSVIAPEWAADWRSLSGRRVTVVVLEANRRRNRVIVRQVGRA